MIFQPLPQTVDQQPNARQFLAEAVVQFLAEMALLFPDDVDQLGLQAVLLGPFAVGDVLHDARQQPLPAQFQLRHREGQRKRRAIFAAAHGFPHAAQCRSFFFLEETHGEVWGQPFSPGAVKRETGSPINSRWS